MFMHHRRFQTATPKEALLSSRKGLQKGRRSEKTLVQLLANLLVDNTPQSLY